ncbi:MAG TPA: TIGR03943 family protein, partial [Pelotomaculum sp.]|nr:TIGR03943 family protein [Pelotomaculum sp.]
MQARAFNPQIFLELLCYSTFGGLMFHLVDSEKYLSYVTPRMKPYLYFTAIVMLIWACVGLGRLFRPQHKIRSAHCFVLVFPILLLLLPHNPLSTADLSDRYIGGKTFSGFTASTGIPAESP